MAKQSGGAKGRSGKGEADAPDVLDLLSSDHRRVEMLAEEFEDAEDEADLIELSQQICDELTVHAQIEEEMFYPAVRKALGEDASELLDEALVEHVSAKDLIAKIESAEPSEPLFRAQVKVLAEYVKHHVWEEENELFERVRNSTLDRTALGLEVRERRLALLAELGLDGEVSDESEDEEEVALEAAEADDVDELDDADDVDDEDDDADFDDEDAEIEEMDEEEAAASGADEADVPAEVIERGRGGKSKGSRPGAR